MSNVSEAEYKEWRNHPVTLEVFGKVEESRKQIVDHLVYAGTMTSHTARDTAKAVGMIQGIDMLLAMDWE